MFPRSLLSCCLLLLALVACADESATADRGPIGKADQIGSCEPDTCGGPAAKGNCWCDDECETYGDCCSNKAEMCDAEVAACGGFAGLTCGEGEYCHYEQEDMCGGADQLGSCQKLPEACIELFSPVCGCDGETYGNSCFANMAGTSVAAIGECDTPAQKPCGGIAGLTCGADQYCHYEPEAMCGAADQLGACMGRPQACFFELNPVCGCDGETYSNSCFAEQAGVSVFAAGACD
jgi:hypothetical protein